LILLFRWYWRHGPERMGVALRAAHSAAPEPRLRRVSAIRLQSL